MNGKILKFYKILKTLYNIYIRHRYPLPKKTYSAEGEDIQISQFFKNKKNGFYVDVGCHHPLRFNNTMLLFKMNWSGINIDINKESINYFNFLRPKDLNLNYAVSNYSGEIDYYYQKSLSLLNTIDKKNAIKVFNGIFKQKKIYSKRLTEILEESKFKNKNIDFLNIDCEGAELDIIKSLNFKIYSPKLICIEIAENVRTEILSSNLIISETETYKFLHELNYKLQWSGTFSHIFSKK